MKTIFDITYALLKTNQHSFFESLTDEEVDQINPFMINRFLSTNKDLLPLICDIERYSLRPKISKREYLKFMYDILPKGFFKLNFPKKEKNNQEKNKEDVLKSISEHYLCNMSVANDYYQILKINNNLTDFVNVTIKLNKG